MTVREAYTVLELPFGASRADVVAAYKKLCVVWHPDRFGAETELHAAAAVKLRAINEAYSILTAHQDSTSGNSAGGVLPTELVDPEVRYFGDDPRLPKPGFLDWSGLPVMVSLDAGGITVAIHDGQKFQSGQHYTLDTIEAIADTRHYWNECGRGHHNGWIRVKDQHGREVAVGPVPFNQVWVVCRDPAGIVKAFFVKLAFRNDYHKQLFMRSTAALLGFAFDSANKPKSEPVTPKPSPSETPAESSTRRPATAAPSSTTASSASGVTTAAGDVGPTMQLVPANDQGRSATQYKPMNYSDLVIASSLIGLLVFFVAVIAFSISQNRQPISASAVLAPLQKTEESASNHPLTPPRTQMVPPMPRTNGAMQQETAHPPLVSSLEYELRARQFRSKGRIVDALADATEAIRQSDRNPRLYDLRGWIHQERGDYRQALQDYQHAIQLDPSQQQAQNNLAWLYATCPDASLRNGSLAVSHATSANQLANGSGPATFQGTLAAAYAEVGDWSRAIECQAEALRHASKAQRPSFESRLRLYQSHQPYRELLVTADK